MQSSSSWVPLSDDTREHGRLLKHGVMGPFMLLFVGAACFASFQYGRFTEHRAMSTSVDDATELLVQPRPFAFRQPLASQRPWIFNSVAKSVSPVWQVQAPPGGRSFDSMVVRSSDDSKEEEGHQPPQGHQSPAMPEMSPEDMAALTKFRDHQQNAARLSNADEVRTLMEYSNGYGVLSTNSKQFDGFPTGSVVGYALDDEGYPFMVFSSMSAHTGDVNSDGKVSLTVLAKDFKGAAEGRCVLIGEMGKLSDDKKAAYRDIYMKAHPEAFWIDFGDFTYYKMNSLKAVRFIGGFARAGSLTGEEYLAAKPDPVAAYASHVMKHMNDDHSDATSAIVQHYVGVPVKDPMIVGMDSLGMTVKANIQLAQGGEAKIRVPWEGGEVTDRKEIKNVIVSMTKASAATAQQAPAPAPSV